MPIQRIIIQGKVPVKIYTDDVDSPAVKQLVNIAQLPFIHSHVAAMPDVHVGIGATVGAVIPTKGAIIPAAVGVDIGCGMVATRLSLRSSQLPDNLRPLRTAIEAAVPVGFAMHPNGPGVPASAVHALSGGLDRIVHKHPGILKMQKNPERTWAQQLGTLGGGNHFIELCLDCLLYTSHRRRRIRRSRRAAAGRDQAQAGSQIVDSGNGSHRQDHQFRGVYPDWLQCIQPGISWGQR